jgi:hypothetical protein
MNESIDDIEKQIIYEIGLWKDDFYNRHGIKSPYSTKIYCKHIDRIFKLYERHEQIKNKKTKKAMT